MFLKQECPKWVCIPKVPLRGSERKYQNLGLYYAVSYFFLNVYVCTLYNVPNILVQKYEHRLSITDRQRGCVSEVLPIGVRDGSGWAPTGFTEFKCVQGLGRQPWGAPVPT